MLMRQYRYAEDVANQWIMVPVAGVANVITRPIGHRATCAPEEGT